MSNVRVRGSMVLPPPDLDDGESLWIGPGARNHGSAVGWGAGFWPGPRTAKASCSAVGRWLSGKIPNSVSREAQDGHQAIRRRSDSTKIK